MRTFWIAGLAAAGFACAGHAQSTEVTGGELRLGYERFSDTYDPGDDVASKTSLEGAMVFGFGPQFGAQVDLALDRFNLADDYGAALELHGFYSISPMTRAGGFAGYENGGGAEVAYWGGEVAVDTGVTKIEGYVMAATEMDSDSSGLVYGLHGNQAVTPRLRLGGRLNLGTSDDDMDVSRIGVTAAFDLTPAAQVEAELGTADTDVAGFGDRDDTYLAVRGKVTFGPGQGAVFDRRGLLDLIPGG